MAAYVEVSVELLAHRVEQLAATAVCALAFAKTEVGIYNLLYALAVQARQLPFEHHTTESVHPFLEPCQCAVGKIYPAGLDVRADERRAVADGL